MIASEYTDKPDSYFGCARVDAVSVFGAPVERVLEVGCGNGATLRLLLELELAREAVGVEGFEAAAAEARKHLSTIHCFDLEDFSKYPNLGRFDVIMCLDVLEHLVQPSTVLEHLKCFLKPGGRLIISLPNVRFAGVLVPLVFAGDWKYREAGVLDKTHLRFFTSRSASRLLREAGYSIDAVYAQRFNRRSISSLLNVLTLGLFSDFLSRQFLLVARNPS